MKGQMHTDLGVIIDEEVIATYAGINEVFGIVGMASVNMKDGFAFCSYQDK